MSFDRECISEMSVRELDALLASAGAEITLATRPARTSKWRVVIVSRIGESTGFGDTLLSAIVDAAHACELAGGLAFLECAS